MHGIEPHCVLLIAEDDPDDRLLFGQAFREARLPVDLRFVEDGEALMDYLRKKDECHESDPIPKPDLILLDLNMPRKDGREVLEEIKADPELRSIPVVVCTTSSGEEDITQSYARGASSFIVKPETYDGLLEAVRVFGNYWCKIAQLPAK